MTFEAEESVYMAAIGALNLVLALLIGGLRPRRIANMIAATMMAFNGAFFLIYLIGRYADPRDPMTLFHTWILGAVNAPTMGALIIFPFFFPRRILSRRGEFVALAIVGAFVLVNIVLSAFPKIFTNNLYTAPVSPYVMFLPFFLGLMVATAVVLHSYLTSPSEIQRTQARFLLAAYILKATTYIWTAWDVPIDLVTKELTDWNALTLAYTVPLGIAAGGPLLAIASSRLRLLRGRGVYRKPSDDLFILGFAAAIFVLGPLLLVELEYTIIRPVLFAYAILRYQLLDVDIRTRRPLVAATILISAGTVFITTAFFARRLPVSAPILTGIAFMATLTVGSLLLWPLIRVLLQPLPDEEEQRSRELYRAALEQAVVAGEGHSTTNHRILRALRDRLRIGEREHAAMDASVRALFGSSAGLSQGQRFLGRYRVEGVVGEGGFGRTYLVHDEQMGRRAVLKAARGSSPDETKRMLREARVIAKLNHPNVVTIYDVEEVAGDAFLILEYVEGGSLADWTKRDRIAAPQALGLVANVLAGLEAAHKKGILHRDIKPANILLTTDGDAKLADFGVARQTSAEATSLGMTTAGFQPGSLHYMSPEQVRGLPPGVRSDLYSVGVILYEALAGRPYLPFRDGAEFDARVAILEQRPKLPLPGVPRDINELLAELLAKEPAQRPASAADVRRRLEAARAAAAQSGQAAAKGTSFRALGRPRSASAPGRIGSPPS